MNEPIATEAVEDDIAYSVTHNPDVMAPNETTADQPASGAVATDIEDIDAGDEAGTEEAGSGDDASEGDPVDMMALNETLEYIRPALQADGGDLILLGVKGGTVNLQLVGACGGCPMSTMTLKQGIERIIFDRVPGATEVIAI